MSEENERYCQIRMSELEKIFASVKADDLTRAQFEENKTRRIVALATAIQHIGVGNFLHAELLQTINEEWKPYNPFKS